MRSGTVYRRREHGAGIVTYELKVDGMSCGHCTAAVETSLKKIEGVVEAQASLESGYVSIETSAEVAVETLLAAVREAGYSAEPAL